MLLVSRFASTISIEREMKISLAVDDVEILALRDVAPTFAHLFVIMVSNGYQYFGDVTF